MGCYTRYMTKGMKLLCSLDDFFENFGVRGEITALNAPLSETACASGVIAGPRFFPIHRMRMGWFFGWMGRWGEAPWKE